jgi:hypothetical protein
LNAGKDYILALRWLLYCQLWLFGAFYFHFGFSESLLKIRINCKIQLFMLIIPTFTKVIKRSSSTGTCFSNKINYREIVIYLRKLLLLIIMATFWEISDGAQAFSTFLVLLAALCLQYRLRPYDSEELFKLETRSLLASCISIYIGMLFLASKP